MRYLVNFPHKGISNKKITYYPYETDVLVKKRDK